MRNKYNRYVMTHSYCLLDQKYLGIISTYNNNSKTCVHPWFCSCFKILWHSAHQSRRTKFYGNPLNEYIDFFLLKIEHSLIFMNIFLLLCFIIMIVNNHFVDLRTEVNIDVMFDI